MILSKLKPLLAKSQAALKLWRPMSEHRVFPMVPSRWQWNKFKDLFHFYVLLGVIPCTLIVGYTNVFIGPATLSEIPEGYVPKHWEYERHPISRFISRYIAKSPQQEYEKYLCYIYMENEKRQMRKVEAQIKQKMSERHDYQAYYYRPVSAKYHRIAKESYEDLMAIQGD